MTELRKGVLFGAAAYTIWGIFPLFWPLLRPAGAFEILAHRIAWSLVVMALLMARLRNLDWLRAIGARRVGLLALAAALVSANWVTYIWAVNHQHVVETALGYFINPLISIILGVFFLGERVRRAQWLALGIAAAAVVILTIDYGRLPWIALTLACSFGLYGFVKKKAGVGALESLTVETGLLFLPALGYLLFLEHGSKGTFGHAPLAKDLLLASCGFITAIPLLCFAASANRVPLTMVGLLQYIAPTLQFLVGVVVMRGFGMVWTGLAIFAAESILHRRRAMQQPVPDYLSAVSK